MRGQCLRQVTVQSERHEARAAEACSIPGRPLRLLFPEVPRRLVGAREDLEVRYASRQPSQLAQSSRQLIGRHVIQDTEAENEVEGSGQADFADGTKGPEPDVP